MPELPEVETIVRDLKDKIIGLTIVKAVVYDKRVIRNHKTHDFVSRLIRAKIIGVYRRGKAIVVEFEKSRYLVIQLGMTGQLIYGATMPSIQHTRVVFYFSDGDILSYNDQRMFGRLILTDDLNSLSYLKSIGVDPLESDFNREWIARWIKKRKIPIKNLLMNQRFIAGIGNIYASEILFSAGINPQRKAERLTQKEIEDLRLATVGVLKEAIRFRGTSMRNYRDASGLKGKFINRIQVYGRDEESCYGCRSPIVRIVQAGRSTFFCERCQR